MSVKRRPTHDRTTRRASGMTLRFEQLEDRTTPTLPTVTAVVATPASLEVGGTLSVTATVSELYPGLLSYQPYGDVRFLFDDTEVGIVPLDPAADSKYASVASLTIATNTFAAGDHTVRVVYPGEEGYEIDGHDPSEGTAAVVLTPPAVTPLPIVPPPVDPPAPVVPQPPPNRPRLFATGTDAGVSGTARLHNPDGSVRLLLQPYGGEFTGGVRVSVGDVTGDGVPDLITAPGPGAAPLVKVYSGADGGEVGQFLAFEPAYTGGVYVATADFDRDGRAELIISPDEGGGPRVRVLAGPTGEQTVADFFGIEDPAFRGGVRVDGGDTNGDGVPDLAVAAGFGGGPRVALFDGRSVADGAGAPVKLVGDFYAFEETLRNGAYVAAGDVTGDGFADLVFGGGPGGGPRVFGLDGRLLVNSGGLERQPVINQFVDDTELRGGVRVSVGDVNGDGWGDLLVGNGAGGATGARTVIGPYFGDPFDIGEGWGDGSGVFADAEPLPPDALLPFLPDDPLYMIDQGDTLDVAAILSGDGEWWDQLGDEYMSAVLSYPELDGLFDGYGAITLPYFAGIATPTPVTAPPTYNLPSPPTSSGGYNPYPVYPSPQSTPTDPKYITPSKPTVPPAVPPPGPQTPPAVTPSSKIVGTWNTGSFNAKVEKPVGVDQRYVYGGLTMWVYSTRGNAGDYMLPLVGTMRASGIPPYHTLDVQIDPANSYYIPSTGSVRVTGLVGGKQQISFNGTLKDGVLRIQTFEMTIKNDQWEMVVANYQQTPVLHMKRDWNN